MPSDFIHRAIKKLTINPGLNMHYFAGWNILSRFEQDYKYLRRFEAQNFKSRSIPSSHWNWPALCVEQEFHIEMKFWFHFNQRELEPVFCDVLNFVLQCFG